MQGILLKIVSIFDWLEAFIETKRFNRLFSSFLVTIFILLILVSVLNYLNIIWPIPLVRFHKITVFTSINITFNLLLFFELLGLIFVIPFSIANSIGKQYEILSLILLRGALEEFGHFKLGDNFEVEIPKLLIMASDGIGALVVFGLIQVYYSFQKHRQITSQLVEKTNFINLKKIIAFSVLIAFCSIGIADFWHFISSNHFKPSYQIFYLILVFADMLFMLVALRYVIHYPNIFRYSAFVLITIFIRVALMSPPYYNSVLGIFSVLFGLGTIYIHNKFFEGSFFDDQKMVKV